jgi:hypothetical protein
MKPECLEHVNHLLSASHHQVVHLCLECEKTSTLLQVLDFIPSQAQKTLIFTSSVAETEIVYKVSPHPHVQMFTQMLPTATTG